MPDNSTFWNELVRSPNFISFVLIFSFALLITVILIKLMDYVVQWWMVYPRKTDTKSRQPSRKSKSRKGSKTTRPKKAVREAPTLQAMDLATKAVSLAIVGSGAASVIVKMMTPGLMRLVMAKVYAQRANKNKRALANITVVGLLVSRKAKQTSLAYLALFSAFLIYYLFSLIGILILNPLVLLFIAVLILALFINQKALEYRIRHGLYGTNEYEAREILNFILSNVDKDDFTTGSGLHEITPEPESESIYDVVGDEGMAGVRI
jgi:hypothetical protein